MSWYDSTKASSTGKGMGYGVVKWERSVGPTKDANSLGGVALLFKVVEGIKESSDSDNERVEITPFTF